MAPLKDYDIVATGSTNDTQPALQLIWNSPAQKYSRSYMCEVYGIDNNREAVSMSATKYINMAIQPKPISFDLTKYAVSRVYKDRVYLANKKQEIFELERANKECIQTGGYLVELEDDQENKFVLEFVKGLDYDIYMTGGNDVQQEGRWVYYNSKKLVPSEVTWMQGEPNNLRNEDCMHFWVSRDGLNDSKCRRTASYVCEVPLSSYA